MIHPNTAFPQIAKSIVYGVQQILERNLRTVRLSINERQMHGWKQPRRGAPPVYTDRNRR
jgi:hypothetical protein